MIYLNNKRKLYSISTEIIQDPVYFVISPVTNQTDLQDIFNNLLVNITTQSKNNVVEFNKTLYTTRGEITIDYPEIEGYYTPQNITIETPNNESIEASYLSCKLTINQTGLSETGYATIRYTMWKSGELIEKQVLYGNNLYVPYNTQITIIPLIIEGYLNNDFIIMNSINQTQYSINFDYESISYNKISYSYTGTVQEAELKPGTYKLLCWGAQGGNVSGSYTATGSKGGYSEGVLTLTKTTTIYIFVGGQGTSSSTSNTSGMANGGWNGGGAAVRYSYYNSSGTYGYSYPRPGGGATDMCLVTSTMNYSSGRTNRSSASLLSRFIVAGGGAGASATYRSEEYETEEEIYYGSVSGGPSWMDDNQSNYYGPFLENGKTYIAYGDTGGYTVTYAFQTSSGSWDGITMPIGLAFYFNRPDAYSSPQYVIHVTNGPSIDITIYEVVTNTDEYTSSDKSNSAQQGGGTSGRGTYPGTQNSAGNGGNFGVGANQTTTNYRHVAGAGGAGWYGGGTNYSDSSTSYVGYSGGGSGFVNTSANAKYRPSGYNGLQLDSGTTTAGNTSFPSVSGDTETGHSGNGAAAITPISIISNELKELHQTEYIENINDDYILTDIIPKGNLTVYYKIKINETDTTKPYFGGRTAIGSSVITLWLIDGKIRKDFGSTGKAEDEKIVPGTIYESSIGDSSGSFTSNSPFALFTVNTGNVIDGRKGICCIYYIKIYDENNNLIHDLQPFKYDNNKGCIRDMVTGKVYYSNSGNITAG